MFCFNTARLKFKLEIACIGKLAHSLRRKERKFREKLVLAPPRWVSG